MHTNAELAKLLDEDDQDDEHDVEGGRGRKKGYGSTDEFSPLEELTQEMKDELKLDLEQKSQQNLGICCR